MTGTAAVFSSRLAPLLTQYVDLKRALGQRFDNPTRTLQSLDRFLQDRATKHPDLNAAAFQAWCQTQEHLASGERRVRMQQVYNFCLYRRRTESHCFVPDPAWFPKPHQRLQPYILSEQEVAKLLRVPSGLKRVPSSPLVASPGRLTSLLAGIASITTRGLSAHAYLHSDEISCRGRPAMSSVLRRVR
jgi:integrase/recombinase XerD